MHIDCVIRPETRIDKSTDSFLLSITGWFPASSAWKLGSRVHCVLRRPNAESQIAFMSSYSMKIILQNRFVELFRLLRTVGDIDALGHILFTPVSKRCHGYIMTVRRRRSWRWQRTRVEARQRGDHARQWHRRRSISRLNTITQTDSSPLEEE